MLNPRTEWVVISIVPVVDPKVTDGNPPAVGQVLVTAKSGSHNFATLTWLETLSKDLPRVGARFTTLIQEERS